MKKFIITSALTALFGSAALAAPAADAPAADCTGVSIATGPAGKGYSLMFKDIKAVCGSKVQLCEVNTSGGLDNLNSLSTKEADLGFVQVDTWNDMKNGDENIAAVQQVIAANNNYLHVVTSSVGYVERYQRTAMDKLTGKNADQLVTINRFTDLRGRTVALVGSAQLLGRRLNKQLGYNMQFIDAKDDASAFAMVKKGQVAAAFTVSGWPSGTVKNLTQADNLTLVPFDAPIGDPYKVKALNYKGIAVYNNNALAIPNVLVTRPFTGQRAAAVASVQTCLIANMDELKQGRYQPGWNEVNPTAAVAGMKQFKK